MLRRRYQTSHSGYPTDASLADGRPRATGPLASSSMPFASVLSAREACRQYSFGDAVLAGWADDGGMLWPMNVPRLDRAQISSWASLTYTQLCAAVLKQFIPVDDADVTHAELDELVSGAFTAFGSSEVVEVRNLPSSGAPLHVAELWHGPTLAFKDLGMSVLGRILSHLLRKRRERLTLLVGTSGDTGSSAIEAVRGLPNIEIIVLFPLQGWSSITPVQIRQMTSVAEVEKNVHVVGVEGSSDDLDVPMEQCFRDRTFKAAHRLGSVNSVNVVRLLVQAVHYFYAYLRLEPGAQRHAQFAVPCGAAGHLAAGLLAVQMGLPIRLIAATNANDALHIVLSSGALASGRPTQSTLSPSMDIQMPYNLWRLLYVASGSDGAAVRSWQAGLAARGKLELPSAVLAWIARHVRTVAVDDAATLAAMRDVHRRSSYFLDPHTAVGVAAAQRAPFGEHDDSESIVCMGCAHVVKFLPTLARAFDCSIDAAIGMLERECSSHKNLAAVEQMARQVQVTADGLSKVTPPGCTAVLRRGEDWEAKVRALVTSVAGRAASPNSRL